MRKGIIPAILLAGFIVGSLDILLAFLSAYLQRGTTPDKVLRYIASGVFDKKAFAASNTSMIAWGLFFHYVIALGFTMIFFFIFPRIKWMAANKVITGILFGIAVWATMHFIVVPLSHTPGGGKFQLANMLKSIAILVIAIGLPLSYFANRFYSIRHIVDVNRNKPPL
ncbi:MAG TPA: hypothetical protein VFX58_13900 [Chitinophagaceae bacterium]|nr:hypothetical protein [Chitinophagaceae bacterium]